MHPARFQDFLPNVSKPFVGVCDSRALLYADLFMTDFPNAKMVIIERDRKEVVDSMSALGFDFESDSWIYAQQIESMQKYTPLRVKYGKLDPSALWQFCVPGCPVDTERMLMLDGFKITLTDKALAVHRK
jgi:Sulfotransferase domain